MRDALKTQLPVGLVVLKVGVDRPAIDLARELVERVRAQVGPVANFKQVVVVARLPKTRSGKVLRKTMRLIADGDAWTMPPTIDDPATLDEITVAFKRIGLARTSGAPIGG